jgi:DNA-binding response OmpR family regulator
MKILIVEDETSLREFLESLFLSCRHDVRAFASGSSAAEVIESWQPDLLICDLGLPDVPGETLAQAAARLPRPARIVLMSGDKQRLERARPLAAGVLCKPFRVEHVMRMVEGS